MSYSSIENWNPMEEDFCSSQFNSYNVANSLFDTFSLYIKSIPGELSRDAFYALISGEGSRKIRRFCLHPPRPNMLKTVGIVTYEKEADARYIMARLNQQPPLYMDVSYAKKNENKGALKDKNTSMPEKNYVQQTEMQCNTSPDRSYSEFENLHSLKIVLDGDKRITYQDDSVAAKRNSTLFLDLPSLVPILCASCKKKSELSCGLCQQPYCSSTCQLQDWPKHKSHCKSQSSLVSKPKQLANDSSYVSEGSCSSDGDIKRDKASVLNIQNTFINQKRAQSQDSNPAKHAFVPDSVSKKLMQDKKSLQNNTNSKFIQGKEMDKVVLSAGRQYKVFISYIESPSDFWVQLEGTNKILSQMNKEMNGMVNKISVKCSTDDVCCIMKGGRFLRVLILEAKSDSSKLCFIDYGGTAIVKNEEIYYLPQVFKKYAAQAIHCSLVDSSASEEIRWTNEDTSSFKFHTKNKIFRAHVHGCSKNLCNIALVNEEDVSIHSILTLSRVETLDAFSEPQNSESKIPCVWADLKEGAEVTIAAVEFEEDKFWGVLDDGSNCQETILEIENLLQKVETEEVNMTCEEGDVAVGFSLSFQQFYRCVVLKRLRNNFLVRYIDYGNQEKVNSLHSLMPALLQKKSFVVCCERPPSLSEDNFKNIFGKGNIVTVKSVKNDVVELLCNSQNRQIILNCFPWDYDIAGINKIPNQPEFPRSKSLGESNCTGVRKSPKKRIYLPDSKSNLSRASETTEVLEKIITRDQIIEKKLTVGMKYAVKVAWIKTASELYINLNADAMEIIKLSEELNKWCNSKSIRNGYIPVVNEIVSCKYSADGTWYRGQVLSKNGNKFKIFFIDFGNEDYVLESDIMPLPQKFVLPKFSICVALYNIENGDISKQLLNKLVSESWIMEIKDAQKSPVKIMLYQDGKSLIDLSQNNAKYPTISSLKTLSLEKDVNNVMFCHAENDIYYCHLINQTSNFVQLAEKLVDPNLKPLHQKPVAGDLVCAKSSDQFWYRALVQGSDSKIQGQDSKYKVIFIDYGNSESVGIADIKCLPDELLQYPVFSIPTKVANMARAKNKIDIKSSLSIKVIGSYSDKIKLVEILLPKGEILPKVDSLEKQLLPTDEDCKVSVCCVQDGIVYVQMVSSIELITELESKLINISEFVNLRGMPEEGDMICAKFVDGVWYRGCVEEVCNDQKSCKICFIDYGNSEIITLENMKVLPRSLCTYPVLSIPVRFKNIGVLENLIQANPVSVFSIKVAGMDSEEIPLVDIVLPDDELELPSIQSQLIPESPTDVSVCYTEEEIFYVQKVSDAKTLQEMMTGLQDPASLKSLSRPPRINELLSAKFVDGEFYRGIIKEKCDSYRYKVFFVDFGNRDIIDIKDIYNLPPKYSSLPMLSIPVVFDNKHVKDNKDALSKNQICTIKYTGVSNEKAQIVKLCVKVAPILFSSLRHNQLVCGEHLVKFTCSNEQFYYLNRVSDFPLFTQLTDLFIEFEKNEIYRLPVVGEVLVIKTSDRGWCRGCIESVNGILEICEVLLIDFGTTETISFSDISCMPDSISSFPVFGVKVQINFPETLVKPIEFGQPQIITVIKRSADDIPVIDVYKRYMFSMLKQQTLPLNELKKVVSVHQDGEKLFLHDVNDASLLSAVQGEVKDACTSQELLQKPVLGELVCAQSQMDGEWYRCCVEEIVSCDKWRVRFIDFGNVEVVTTKNLRSFTGELTMYNTFAIAVKVNNNNGTEPKIELDKLYTVMAEKSEDDMQIIKLVHQLDSQLDALSDRELEVMEDEKEHKYFYSNAKYVSFPTGEQNITIYYVSDDAILFCAPFCKKAIETNLHFSGMITEYCENLNCSSFNRKTYPEQDELVLAKYNDDGLWYRAVILDNSSHPMYDVIFVDFGNSDCVHIDSIRKMDQKFMDLEMQTHLCLLSGFDIDGVNMSSVVKELRKFTVFANPTPVKAFVSHIEDSISLNIPTITSCLLEKDLVLAVTP